MELSPLQRRDFYEDGYLVLRGAVAPLMVEAARQAINRSLEQGGLNPDDLPRLRQTSFCGDLGGTALLTNLFDRSALLPIFESLFGEGNLQKIPGAQIPLRFPGHGSQTTRQLGGHLDGIGTGLNGIPKGEYTRGFTALAVVLLSDLPEPWRGNFTVWPGSHRTAEDYFKHTDPDILKQGRPTYDLPREPVQITGKAGDVCISHHMIWHAAAPNHGPDIRYAAIFRAKHRDVDANGTEAMSDIWREWPGVREVIEEQEQSTPVAV